MADSRIASPLWTDALQEWLEQPTLAEMILGRHDPSKRMWPDQPLKLTYDLLAGNRSTVARVNLELPPEQPNAPAPTLHATGEARRQKGDQPDWRVGHMLALGRALQTLGAMVEQHGHTRDRISRPVTFRFVRPTEDVPLPDQGPPE
ncbi:MAG: DUF1876 family protein [Candidatus Nanopelagicales bacterium]|jgi:hypothetical protein|nr:DUF1876 family protein [Candidatus Nanopelagicales bacterium]